MSISMIRKLSLNPHYYAILIQSFLSGYDAPCEIKLAFMSIPVLLCSESRDKLKHANKASRIDTLFKSPLLIREVKISGKTRLSGYIERYNYLMPYSKKAIIILSSENKLELQGKYLVLLQKLDYRNYSDSIKEWTRCAYYLGIIFSKSTIDQLSYYLGFEAYD